MFEIRRRDPVRELRRRRDQARRRVAAETPFSPAWDAAMARLEDLEQVLWRVEPVHARREAIPTY